MNEWRKVKVKREIKKTAHSVKGFVCLKLQRKNSISIVFNLQILRKLAINFHSTYCLPIANFNFQFFVGRFIVHFSYFQASATQNEQIINEFDFIMNVFHRSK